MVYATYEKLCAALAKAPDRGRAEELLARASRAIDAECAGAAVDPGAIDGELLADVCCEMVERALGSGFAEVGATQGSMTVGPFNASSTWSAPVGDLYLTAAQKRRLGILRQRVGFAQARRGEDDVPH